VVHGQEGIEAARRQGLDDRAVMIQLPLVIAPLLGFDAAPFDAERNIAAPISWAARR